MVWHRASGGGLAAVLVATALVWGCGEAPGSQVQVSSPEDETPTETANHADADLGLGAGALFFGEDAAQDAVTVLEVDATGRRAAPLRAGALPLSAATVDLTREGGILRAADGTGAVVVTFPGSDEAAPRLFVSREGAPWEEPLAFAPGESVAVVAGGRAAWVVAGGIQDGAGTLRYRLVGLADGATWFEIEDQTLPGWRVLTSSAEGGWVGLLGDGREVVAASATQVATLTTYAPDANLPANPIQLALTESALLNTAWPALEWVRLDGAPNPVEGFLASREGVIGAYQLRGGQLEHLSGDGLEPTGVPVDALSPYGVVGHRRDRYAVIDDNSQGFSLIGADGATLGSYRPLSSTAPATIPIGWRQATPSAFASSLTDDRAIVLVRTTHDVLDGDQGEQVEITWDLWTWPLDGEGRAWRIIGLPPDVRPSRVQLSATGAFVAWALDGALTVHDRDAESSTTLDTTPWVVF